jgi:hypothetical protein
MGLIYCCLNEMGQKPWRPSVHTKITGKWGFHPLKYDVIGFVLSHRHIALDTPQISSFTYVS